MVTDTRSLNPSVAAPEGASQGARLHAPPATRRPERIVFVGPVAGDVPGGSVVKNALLVDGFRQFGVDVTLLDTVDTSLRGRLRQLGGLLRLLATRQGFVLSLNRNGVFTIVPLFGLATLFRPGLRATVIGTGSGLPRNVTFFKGFARRLFVWCLTRARPIYVQGDWIKRDLDDLGVSDVRVLSNLRPRPTARWSPAALAERKLVFVSRVIPDKGVERAMAAVETLRAGGLDVTLDVYGPVPPEYAKRFEAVLERSPGSSYRGVLKPEAVTDALAPYAAMVLPTTWSGEGMPGIVVEAGMVGMPVIASDLVPIAEVIDHGRSGLLVDPHDPEALVQALRTVLTQPDYATSLAGELHRTTSEFTIEAVIGRLCEELVAEGWS